MVQRLSSSASRFWLRPAKDLLQRVPKISASQPAICDVCCGDGSSSHMLLEWCPSVLQLHCLDTAEAISALQRDDVLASRSAVRFVGSTVNAHFDGSPTGSLYDLIVSPSGMIPRSVSSTDLLDLLQRQMARVRPGGSLALQIPDARLQPSHLLLEQVRASAMAHSRLSLTLPASRLTPHASCLTPHASRLTLHASHLTPHASRRSRPNLESPPTSQRQRASSTQLGCMHTHTRTHTHTHTHMLCASACTKHQRAQRSKGVWCTHGAGACHTQLLALAPLPSLTCTSTGRVYTYACTYAYTPPHAHAAHVSHCAAAESGSGCVARAALLRA